MIARLQISRALVAFTVTAFILVGLVACASGPGAAPTAGSTSAPASTAAGQASNEVADYHLGSGDKLRVTVFGEDDLSGEFDVSGTGTIALPLIGQVPAAGLTIDQFEADVASKLRNGYLTDPRVSVEVLNYRPFYIIGEVDKPGQYPYTNGMTVLNAVAVAGGYTYRANEDEVYITRGSDAEVKYPASQSVKVLPGDVVRVPERLF